jgi:uncharacterized damage-inducible protein DinB
MPEPTDERSVLLDYLGHYRQTLERKCADLDAEQLARRAVPPSNLSLLGLVRHLADAEAGWFREVMSGEAAPLHFRTADDVDAAFNGAVADPAVVAEAWQCWRAEVANAERVVAEAPSLDVVGDRDGVPIVLRELLVHMIEEYARHCGHADLIREVIDGRTGE